MIRNMARMSIICQYIKAIIKQQHINPHQTHQQQHLEQAVQSVQPVIQ